MSVTAAPCVVAALATAVCVISPPTEAIEDRKTRKIHIIPKPNESEGLGIVWPAKKHLWVASIDGKKKAEQLEELLGESDTPRWSPDGKRIAFRSNRKDHSFIAILELATKKITYLTPTTSRDAEAPNRPRTSPKHLAPGMKTRWPG